MGAPSRITLVLSRWIDEVSEAVLAGIEQLRAAPRARLAEQKDGSFVLEEIEAREISVLPGTLVRLKSDAPGEPERLKAIVEGASVEVLLQPNRFLFRPLELPARAGEFLEGIVQAQIDRLTPWSPANALFGWSAPIETSNGRMVITVAATGRSLVEPLTAALSGFGAASIRLGVRSPEPGGAPIMISDQKTRTAREAHHTRRILLGILAGFGVLAALSIMALIMIGSMLEAKQAENTERLDAIRASLQARHDPASEPAAALLRRKQEAPSNVLVLEALSGTLPDHTYLTEIRLQDGKVQIIGMTDDAPSLIELLERSPHFSEASFFAPTTRSLTKRGDNFHIEAKIRPPGPVKQ